MGLPTLVRRGWAVESPGDSDAARPCRPTVSCTADLAAPGTLEVEVGGYSSKAAGDARTWTDPILLKETLTRILQLQVGSNACTAGPATGPASRYVDNLVVGPKLHLLDRSATVPSLALPLQASLPVFSHPGAEVALFAPHASKDLARVHADWNAGVDGGDRGWFPSAHAYGVFAGVTVIPVVLWKGEERSQ